MNGRVEGKVALVTGAAAGLGRAQAELLAREGARVVVTDINEAGCQSLARQICKNGGDAMGLAQDVVNEEDWLRVIGEIDSRYGTLDILVNNAGVVIPKTVEETTLEEWRWLMGINLDAVFLGTRQAIAYMKDHGGGSIVNISSIEGMIGEPLCAAYNASKGGVRIFTKSAALHCAKEGYNIRVNSVHPGYILTPMLEQSFNEMADGAAFKKQIEKKHPVGHMGEPMDVAYGVLYLASEESKFATGSELVIDGGYTAQ